MKTLLTALVLSLPLAASAATDPFGVTQLYPTASGGKEWNSTWNNGVARTFGYGDDPRDTWFHGKGNATYSIDGQGLFKISGAVPRMYIYDPAQRSAWHNVEMTVYAMRVSDSGTSYGGVEGVARTNHTADTTNLCDTRGVDARFRYDGHIDFEKETSHPNSVAVQNKPYFPGGLPYNKWIGYKLVVYDLPNGNVKLENYMDLTDGVNGGTWIKVNELEDTGSNFGLKGKACKGGIDPAMKLTASDVRAGSETGKPNLAVYWRSDNVGTNGLLYKKMTVREVQAAAAPSVDVAAPAISAVSAVPSATGATVTWSTSEPADGQVEYGTTSAYGTASVLDASPAASHAAALTGLSAGTLYHYRVKSKDAAGNLAVSPDATFTTSAAAVTSAGCALSAGSWQNLPLGTQTGSFTAEFDATPSAAKIDGTAGLANGAASAYSSLAAAVRFNNSGFIDARSGSAYAAASAIPYSAGLSYHFRLVVDLTAKTYSAWVRQGSGAEALIGSNHKFRTEQAGATALSTLGVMALGGSETACSAVATAAASSITPAPSAPVITGAAASGVGPNGAMISWTTDILSDTQVEYGPTAAYGQTTALDASMVNAHVGNLLALTPSTVYHYRVKSRSSGGALAVGGDLTFTTPSAPSAGASVSGSFYDDFKTYPQGACLADGAPFGAWTAAYAGYGCTKISGDGVTSWVEEAPQASATAAETHASMILGPRFSGARTYSFNYRTVSQLRTGSSPNAWEVAWIAWNYADDVHFYYFALKPNGWELGKEDPAYPGAQRFLASGASPVYPVGPWHNVRVEQDASNTIKVWADDVLLVTFTDKERPYTSGRLAFYNEDSRVQLKDVASSPVGTAAVVVAAASPATAPQRLLSPSRSDGINDEAVFGPAAEEVRVYDLRGRSVYAASRSGGTLAWNGRDGAGRVVESGVYIARIRASDGAAVYQSFVVAK